MGPIDAEGYVDFHAALNRHLGEGVSASDNAAIPFLRSIGPDKQRPELLNLILRELKQPEWSPEDGQWVYMRARSYDADGKPEEEAVSIKQELGKALKRPWKAEECPRLATLLKKNEAAMAVIAQGARRSLYFRPLIATQPSELLLHAWLGDVETLRDVARQFGVRALLQSGSGNLVAARDDLITALRMGRHVSRGATVTEGLVSIAMEDVTCKCLMAHAADSRQTVESLSDLRKAIRELPSREPLARCIKWGERMSGLDAVQWLARGRPWTISDLIGELTGDDELEADAALRTENVLKSIVRMSVDWNSVISVVNGIYDDLSDVTVEPVRTQRRTRLEAFNARLEAERQQAVSYSSRALSVFRGPKPRGRDMGKILASLLLPAVRDVSTVYDRAEMRLRLVDTGLAVLQYRQAHDSWPAELSALGEEFLAEPPTDLFNDQPIRYVVETNRVLLYSVGPNGRDDGGRPFNNETDEDDIVVTIGD